LQHIGTLAAAAEEALLDCYQGKVFTEEAVRAELNTLRTSRAELGDGALERMLAARVALTWFALHRAEVCRAGKWRDGCSVESGDFWDRHVSRLNEDFLRASKALAKVRHLRRPAVQVNIGAQQVNVADGQATSRRMPS
jgi:hypothetical protein